MRAKVDFGHHGLHVLEAAIGVPHLAAVADHRGHGGVHDDVVGRVEVGDALGRIHHGQLGPVFVAGVQVALDLVLRALRQRGDLVVQVDHAVVDVDAQLLEQLGVLLERVLVEDLHAVAEHDGVRHLHHRGLHVQREHHAGLAGVFDLLLVELHQRLLAHEHAVDDLAVEQLGQLGLEHDGLAALGDQLHASRRARGRASSTFRRGRSRHGACARRASARPGSSRPCCAGSCARTPSRPGARGGRSCPRAAPGSRRCRCTWRSARGWPFPRRSWDLSG
jgi:hypothetical protein